MRSSLMMVMVAVALATFTGCGGDKGEQAPAEHAQATAHVVDEPPTPATPEEALRTALAAAERPVEDRARDADRKPDQVLKFYNVLPGQTVVELMAGGGYYSEIFYHYLGPKGRLYVTRLNNKERAARLSDAVLIPDLSQVADDSADLVFTSLNYHDMVNLGVDRNALLAQILRALKPGGEFAVIDHAAEAGSKDRDVGTLHRIDEEFVKAEVLAAGFQWQGANDLLRNSDDDRHARVMDASIRGRTDQFMFKFVKPGPGTAAAPAADALEVSKDEEAPPPTVVPALQSMSEVDSPAPADSNSAETQAAEPAEAPH